MALPTNTQEHPGRLDENVLKQAEEQDEAVAILNHNKPAGYIVSPRMMESMLDAIADRIADDRARSRIGTLKLAKKITVNDL